MMRVASASEPGDLAKANEDWVAASEGLVVVLDGATARTDTGCVHGVSWYAAKLGGAITSLAADHDPPLADALGGAIAQVADMHSDCDLTHTGTPSAAVAIVRSTRHTLQYLVLGDATVILNRAERGLNVISDPRVDATATFARVEADRHPIGSPEKHAALLTMKHAELAARNQPGGFWVAAADPSVASHAITGAVARPEVREMAVLTDGAARIVNLFRLLDWPAVLDLLANQGPRTLIERVRAVEAADPNGRQWPRNKRSDDATIVYGC